MPATKPSKKVRGKSQASAKVALEVLTLDEAAAFLRVSSEEVEQAVLSSGMPGQKVGTTWRFYRQALQQWLSQSRPALRNYSFVGSGKDDPHLAEILKDIYQRRDQLVPDDDA